MSPIERVTGQLDNFIEYHKSALAKAATGLPVPATLQQARRATSEANQKVRELQKQLSGAEDALAVVRDMRGPMFSWMTNFAERKQSAEQKALARGDNCNRLLNVAEIMCRDAESNKRRLERQYRSEARHFLGSGKPSPRTRRRALAPHNLQYDLLAKIPNTRGGGAKCCLMSQSP